MNIDRTKAVITTALAAMNTLAADSAKACLIGSASSGLAVYKKDESD